jgi:subfamily B ATP-binding cassette protein MsbA
VLLYQPAKELGRASQFATQGAAAAERILDVLDLRPVVMDGPAARPAPRLQRAVRLEGVRLDYGDRPALRGLSLDIPVGQLTALVGPSGGGKSTVAALLLRFLRPDAGRLVWDDVDVEGCTVASLRAQTALVTQEPLLFSGTVRENLLAAHPDATPDALAGALRVASAAAFVSPCRSSTRRSGAGVRLSGGQRQRLALARAVLRDASLWVLDEATSSLDPRGSARCAGARGGPRRAHRAGHRPRLQTVARLTASTSSRMAVVESGTHADCSPPAGGTPVPGRCSIRCQPPGSRRDEEAVDRAPASAAQAAHRPGFASSAGSGGPGVSCSASRCSALRPLPVAPAGDPRAGHLARPHHAERRAGQPHRSRGPPGPMV